MKVVGTRQERFRPGPREGRGEPVHLLAALAAGELPVGERAQVAERVADSSTQLLRRAAAHVVEVDDDGDGAWTPYDPLRPSCSSDATGEAIPSCERLVATETIGSPARPAAYLATSSVRPPPIPTTASNEPARQPAGQFERRLDGAALDRKDLGVLERGADGRHDLVALPGTDHDCDVTVRGDAPIAEQGDECGDSAAADLDRERTGDQAG